MSAPSLQTYEQLILRSGLVSEDQLREAAKQLRAEANGEPLSPQRLSQRLIADGLLTQWQNDKLMQGKHQGFFLGKYKLLKHLSSGGMSSVYLAEHTLMQRKVAIKVLPPARIEDTSYLPRFQRECRVMASLDHNNVVRAHDFDVDGRLHYLVLEYIDGLDLQRLVETEGAVDFDKAAHYIAQAADGLGHAHEMKMVHRDMKPANLMVDRRGMVKVLDLGVARIVTGDDDTASLTLAHKEDVLGTADFLAPEQALNSHHVDHRADIYALGCTLYYLITAGVPFKEQNLAKKLMAHQTQEPPSILEARPDCPPGLVAVCRKMMAKELDERYQTMEEVSADLRRWQRQWEAGRKNFVPTAAEESVDEPVAAVTTATVHDAARNGTMARVGAGAQSRGGHPGEADDLPPGSIHDEPSSSPVTNPSSLDREVPQPPSSQRRHALHEDVGNAPVVPPGASTLQRGGPVNPPSTISRSMAQEATPSERSISQNERSSSSNKTSRSTQGQRVSRRSTSAGQTPTSNRPRYSGGRTAAQSGPKKQMLIVVLLFIAALPVVLTLIFLYGDKFFTPAGANERPQVEQSTPEEPPSAPSGPRL